ncbi:37S ribosomal protein RSM18, mitochondrial [Leucoagaricus sp. SymC.cos]|nr:37S ribosomal protein RSM18, mitochondrial [Leucoagaricus sp. SymC.cos]
MLASLRPSLSRASHVLARRSSSSAHNTEKALLPGDFTGLTKLLEGIPSGESSLAPQNGRNWRIFYNGEVVTPNELTPEKCANKPKRTRRAVIPPPTSVTRYNDLFRQLDIDPVEFSLNPSVLSAYVSEMGKIYGRNITGLTSRSQRRLGKAIRRARMIGILPQLSRPPKTSLPNPQKPNLNR